MFETAELGRKVAKRDFKRLAAPLREELLQLQERLRRGRDFQVILLFSGVEGGGKGETVGLLNEWMDPRWLMTRAYDEPRDAERERPEFWRYWRDLPPAGRIGMFLSAWYHATLLDRVYRDIDEAAFVRRLDRIIAFERALAQDGALILKFWMHLSASAQEARLKSLEHDPLTKARVTPRDWENWRNYPKFIAAAEALIARTNRGMASWSIVEGADPYYRGLTVATILRDALVQRLSESEQRAMPAKPAKSEKKKNSNSGKAPKVEIRRPGPAESITVLSGLDMSQKLEKATYRQTLPELQAQLHLLHLRAKEQGVSSILVFEGVDAAGKGGAIRRIQEGLEPRNYQVHGIAAPTEEELAQHYLWRFWRQLSPAGRVTIFDRSWYGRVLVERIEGFATEDEWRRAYAEINDFESQLIEHGIVVVKYWVHITKKEQLARFKLREKTPHKRWKLTDEDWRNRAKWDLYEAAVNDMVQYTSTSSTPWHLIEGNDKLFARIKVLEIFCKRLAAALDTAEQRRPAAATTTTPKKRRAAKAEPATV
ncbi:MAG: polyphosphate:AMP phosphotransferase [Kiloniellales bacterium]|nr:polyphosphate:AMP phosphotransferase [Kiloniellales bacterium]